MDSSDIPGHDVPGAHPSAILDYSRKGWEGPDPVRSTLLKFIAPAPGGDGTGYKQYLAVVCFLFLPLPHLSPSEIFMFSRSGVSKCFWGLGLFSGRWKLIQGDK